MTSPDDCPHANVHGERSGDGSVIDVRCLDCGLLINRASFDRAAPVAGMYAATTSVGPWMLPGPNQYRR